MVSKQEERAYLDKLLEHLPELGAFATEGTEKPDFILHAGERVIGVEVTRFAPEKDNGRCFASEQHSLRNRVLEVAARRYAELSGPPLEVAVTFREWPVLTKRTVPTLGANVAWLVRECHRKLVFGYEFAQPVYADESDGFAGIQRIVATPSRTDESSWITAQPIWYAHATDYSITCAVAAKERRIPTYLDRCDEIWLLIAFLPLGARFDSRLPVDPVDLAVPTRFDRVFCVDVLRDRCVEIATRLPEANDRDVEPLTLASCLKLSVPVATRCSSKVQP